MSTKALFVVILFSLCGSPAAAQVTPANGNDGQLVSMSVADARVLARAAVLQGEPELARDIAAAILREDQEDRTALIVLAVVEPQLGRPTQGRLAGVRAWRVSDTRPQRYEAARLTAGAATREGQHTLAQFWLRRAAANAPNAAALDQSAEDYALLRRINPWNIQLRFDAVPSSNVNGGSSSDVYEIDGVALPDFVLSGDAQALSGWLFSGDARVTYRLSSNENSRTSVSFRLYRRLVELTDDARRQAPDAKDRDFSTTYTTLTYSYDQAAENGFWGLDGTIGRSWFGGDLNYEFARLGADRNWRFADTSYRLGTSIERRRDSDGVDIGRVFQVSAGGSRGLELGQLTYNLTLETTTAPQENNRSDAARLSSGFAFREAIGPAQISVGAGIGWRRFPDYTLIAVVPGGREDTRVWGSLSATFTDWSYAGFAPVVLVETSRTESNVSRFDRSATTIGLTIRSTF